MIKNKKLPLVQVEDLLHEFICAEGHGLGGHTADVVERKASVQSVLNPILLMDVRQGLDQRAVVKSTDKDRLYFNGLDVTGSYFYVLNSVLWCQFSRKQSH